MSLGSGTRLGAYEILTAIGAGGMGQVYRARDTKLGREVAIKVLPEEFTQHPQKLARFEREARLLAALNHPGIATLYGVEEFETKPFLVMELVEGETLAERIARGPLPVTEALTLSRQIAEALEAAHEKGVIHRDLKPANIKVDPEGHVKVLDFGLAKLAEAESESAGEGGSQSPTLSRDATRAGVILGTAAYMSPEQAKGKAVDKRTDIFSFGIVLYEMLTGKRAFSGDDVSDVLASVIKLDIDWKALPSDLDPRIRKLLSRCLMADRKKRLRDMGDVRNEIEEILAEPVGPAKEREREIVQTIPQSKSRWLAAVALTALVASGGMWLVLRPDAPPVVRATLVHPGTEVVGHLYDSPVAVSPDGRRIAYIAPAGGVIGPGRLYVRRLDELEPTLLAESALSPVFSPDGQWVGFKAGPGPWQRVAVTGGPAVPIGVGGDWSGARGATWGPDDTIVFATGNPSTGLSRIPAAGGEAEVLTTPNREQGVLDHLFPEFLPGGRGVLFTIRGIDNRQIALLDLDTREYRVLIEGGSHARYAASGHIVYGVAGTLRAVPFDLDSLKVRGTPTPVLEGVATQRNGAAGFSLAPDGTLVYVAGGAISGLRTPVWVDRDGREEAIPAEPRGYEYLRISHDGRRVAIDECNLRGDIWVWSFAGENAFRLTTGERSGCYPAWTSDDARIAFGVTTEGVVFSKASNNTGSLEPLTRSLGSGTIVAPYFFSGEDRVLVFMEGDHPETWDNIGMISLEADAEPEWLLASEFNERNAELSPDGGFMAYQSNESGRFEVYVRPFPNVNDGLWVLSSAGGIKPLWSRDGRELFFIEPGTPARLMSVPVQTGSAFEHQSPREVLEWPYDWEIVGRSYDVSPDGKRFLTLKAVETGEDTPPPQINIVTNWFEELKRIAPTN